jgi:predicted enzyme related to lactoylglutathione lyase
MRKLIAWVEVPTLNIKRSVEFYNAVFDLNLDIADYGEEKMACFPTGEGAISFAPDFKPSEHGVLVSFNTGKEIDATQVKVTQNGGKIVKPKTKIEAEGRGYFSIVTDCEGNRIGLYGE